MSELAPGAQLGHYLIERELGRGGMGAVYAARDQRLNRRVALKVIVAALARDPQFRARFERESRIAATLEHPHVVPVYDVGEIEGVLYIAMRFVGGQDLATALAETHAMAPPRFARLMLQVGSALDAAHASGLVHRDVKPANVLLAGAGGDEHAYLTDFGLTRDATSDSGLTGTGQWIGTVDYAAPEQIDAGRIDARTDVYAAACMGFHALTGRVPFPGGAAAKLHGHLSREPPRASELNGSLPPGVDDALARGMAKAPDDRYPSAGDLARALSAAITSTHVDEPERTVATGRALTGIETVVAAPPTRPAPTTPRAPRPASPEPRPRSGVRPVVLALGAAVVLAAGVGAALALSGGGDEPTASAPATATETARSEPAPKARTVVRTVERTVPATAPAPEPGAFAYHTPESGFYGAELPTGNGWRVLGEEELNPGLLRTIVIGPNGETMWIDVTPAEAPGFDTSDVNVQSDRQLSDGIREIVFRAESPEFCASDSCALYQLVRGDAGVAVIAGPSYDARAAARRVATSMDTHFG